MQKTLAIAFAFIFFGVLSGCGGGGDGGEKDDLSILHQGQIRALDDTKLEAFSNQEAEQYAAQLQAQAERGSTPELQARPQAMPAHPGLAGGLGSSSGLLGESSATQNNGRVVDVMVKWLKLNNNGRTVDSPVSYVVFSFLSDSVLETNSIEKAAAQTEVWRYSGASSGRWCRLLTLPFSTVTVLPLEESPASPLAPSGAIAVTFLTGSSDGIVGKVRFWDIHPETTSCASQDVQSPSDEGSHHLYSTLIPATGVGSIDHMKLIPITEKNAAEGPQPYATYQYLYTWGDTLVCLGSAYIDAKGHCSRTQFRELGVNLLKDNRLAENTGSLSLRPTNVFSYGARLNANNPDNAVIDFDARIDSTSSGFTFTYLIGFAGPLPDPNSSTRHNYLYWGQAQGIAPLKIPSVANGADVHWRDVSSTARTIDKQNGQNDFPPTHVLLDKSNSAQIFSINATPLAHGGLSIAKCYVNGKSQCDFDTFDGSLLAGFTWIKSFAPASLLRTWNFYPETWSTSIKGLHATSELIFTAEQQTQGVKEVARVNTDIDRRLITRTLIADWYLWEAAARQRQPYKPAEKLWHHYVDGLYIGQLDAFVAPANNQQLKVYRVARLDDIHDEIDNQKVEQYTKGGIVLCSTTIIKSSISTGQASPNTAACAHPRNSQHEDGYVYSAAQDIFPNQTYLSSPLFTRYSVSPSGSVLLTYVSLSGGIAQIDASEISANWQSRKSWTVLSQGRSAKCSTALVKPAPPNAPASAGFWQEALAFTTKKGISQALKTLTTKAIVAGVSGATKTVAGPIAGIGVDIAMSVYSSSARALDKKEAYAKWMQVYDGIKLKNECN